MHDDVLWVERLVHDLKGPLAPLQTAAYLLRADGLGPERQRELAGIVDRQSRRLAAMIDEAGDWARVSQQPLVLRPVPCALAHVLDLAIGAVPGCRVEPAFAPGDADALQVRGDEARLVQMFLALVGYQAWRDPAGTPTLEVARSGGDVRVRLCDAGAPMGAAAMAALFTEPSPEPHDAGLGLRLMIAAAIARGHGGRLTASERDGGGLCLSCELPLG
ncbi:sensor histidine kinase [Lysobacter koreensis]|uniref:histidine kinase n=1 Tax=Lysobacter koreensis TaxID=266122 RepID=A0ABW2YPK5_9GAMM